MCRRQEPICIALATRQIDFSVGVAELSWRRYDDIGPVGRRCRPSYSLQWQLSSSSRTGLGGHVQYQPWRKCGRRRFLERCLDSLEYGGVWSVWSTVNGVCESFVDDIESIASTGLKVEPAQFSPGHALHQLSHFPREWTDRRWSWKSKSFWLKGPKMHGGPSARRMRHLPHPCLSRSGVEVSTVTRMDVRKKNSSHYY